MPALRNPEIVARIAEPQGWPLIYDENILLEICQCLGENEPFSPEVAAIKAGKLMLDEIDRFRNLRVDFAFETTLSGKTYIRLLKEMKEGGHKIHVYFLWLRNVELALDRVKNRVAMGGHNVPAETVRRRFDRGLHNLFHLYRVLADSWIIFDNSEEVPRVIAKETSGVLTVVDGKLFKGIKTKMEIS